MAKPCSGRFGFVNSRIGVRAWSSLEWLIGSSVSSHLEHLADVIKPPAPGPLSSVDEVPSTTNYYDGSLNLNVA